jgi:hypothetical protein
VASIPAETELDGRVPSATVKPGFDHQVEQSHRERGPQRASAVLTRAHQLAADDVAHKAGGGLGGLP